MKRPSISVRSASVTMFGGNSAPNFDAIILALILPISYFGVLRGLTMRTTDEFRASFIHQDVLTVLDMVEFADWLSRIIMTA